MTKKIHQGYIALSSILVISAVVLVIGISTSLLSVNDLLSSTSGKKGDETVDFVEACIEDALLRLNKDNTIPTTITLPVGDCSVTINSQVGNDWDFTVEATLDGFTRKIRVVATRSSSVTITSWQESP